MLDVAKNGILLLCLHPHSTKYLQPSERTFKGFDKILQYSSEQSIAESVRSGCVKTAQLYSKPAFDAVLTNVRRMFKNLRKLEKEGVS
jgi:hypothetical protein